MLTSRVLGKPWCRGVGCIFGKGQVWEPVWISWPHSSPTSLQLGDGSVFLHRRRTEPRQRAGLAERPADSILVGVAICAKVSDREGGPINTALGARTELGLGRKAATCSWDQEQQKIMTRA